MQLASKHLLWPSLALLAGSACGDDSTSPDASGVAVDSAVPSYDANPSIDSGGPLTPGPVVGRIALTERRGPATDGCGAGGERGWLRAEFSAVPYASYYTATMERGSCRLLEYQVGTCENCTAGVCLYPNICQPFPQPVAVGELALTGTKVPIEIEQLSGTYYQPTQPPLPGDLFDDGDSIIATATGDILPAFSVTATGVASLTSTITDDTITLLDGQDHLFTWTPSTRDGARVRVTIRARNDGHGRPNRAIIECDGPDAGSLTIAQELVEAFPSESAEKLCFGYDCACSEIARYSRSTTGSTGGDIELVVASQLDFLVIH